MSQRFPVGQQSRSSSLSMFELVPGLDNNWPAAKRGIMVGVDLITLMEIKITSRGEMW